MLGVELMRVFADEGLESLHSVVRVDDVTQLPLQTSDQARHGGQGHRVAAKTTTPVRVLKTNTKVQKCVMYMTLTEVSGVGEDQSLAAGLAFESR